MCEVVEIGGKEPIQGSVFQNGRITKAVLSVQGIPAIQKTLSPTANGLIIDLKVTLFSLLLTGLDGVPVAQHVSVVTSTTVTAAPLLTCGNETSAWPYLSDVPSFRGGRKKIRIFVWAKSLVSCSFHRYLDTRERYAQRGL